MSKPYCNVCGKSVESEEDLTYLKLYINGSEGTHACEDCRMDITNFTRQLASSMTRAKRDIRVEIATRSHALIPALSTPFLELQSRDKEPGIPIEVLKENPMGPGERMMFEFTSPIGNSALGYELAPGALRKQILDIGKVETNLGEEFVWEPETEKWKEVAAGRPRELRVFDAAESGFPDDDEDIEWRFSLPAFKTGHGIRKSDGTIHTDMKVDELRITEDSPQ